MVTACCGQISGAALPIGVDVARSFFAPSQKVAICIVEMHSCEPLVLVTLDFAIFALKNIIIFRREFLRRVMFHTAVDL